MDVLYLNYSYNNDLKTPSELLKAYHVIPDWCRAVRKAGARKVTVVQRFGESIRHEQDGVEYFFVDDGRSPDLAWWQYPSEVHRLVVELLPDVVHINGNAYLASHLRSVLKLDVPIVWQHHGGGYPSWHSRWLWKQGFRHVDGVLFTSITEAAHWQDCGLMNSCNDVYEILEASTTFKPLPYHKCRSKFGMQNQSVFLWVGRLNTNKDPLTLLRGFSHFTRQKSKAHLYIIYSEASLLEEVKKSIKEFSLENQVHLVGFVQHEDLPRYYSAADFFVLGSHSEGSGFALIEALACGSLPLVTDIPSFRKITGDGKVGLLWQPGNPYALAEAIKTAVKRKKSRKSMRSYFSEYLSYDAIGRAALKIYIQAYEKRRGLSQPRVG